MLKLNVSILGISIFVITLVCHAITLEGYIATEGLDSEPFANVSVRLTDPSDTNIVYHDITDQLGYFEIEVMETGITEHSPLPDKVTLYPNYPNPFNPSTIICYDLPHPGFSKLVIYNLLGQQVRLLDQGYASAGLHQTIWDGRDNHGNGVTAGVYIYSLSTDNGERINKKMLLLDGNHTPITTLHTALQQQTFARQINKQHYFILQLSGDDILEVKQEITFSTDTTLHIKVQRTLTDIDGNIYPIVKIGNQWWMAKNLKVTHYANGDSIPHVTGDSDWSALTSGALCYYDNDSNNARVYGALYNWYAATDIRSIAPEGWHVSSDQDWLELEIYLGLEQTEIDSIGWRGTDIGGKLKISGLNYWNSPNTGANNITEFTALPAGYRDYFEMSTYKNMGIGADFWTSTQSSKARAWHHVVYYDRASIYRNVNNKQHGFSIRLVKD